MSDALIQEFLSSIIGEPTDHSQARRQNADKILNDFLENMNEVNSPKDFAVKRNEIKTINPYFAENQNAINLMSNTIQEREDAYHIYNTAVLGAQKLIEDNKVWLEGSPEKVFDVVKLWTVDDVWATANKIRKIKSGLEFGLPAGPNNQGQNFTQGMPGNKATIDEFTRLEQMLEMILDDAVASKKHTFKYNQTQASDGSIIEKEAFIPLLTRDDIRNILLGDSESFEEKRTNVTDRLVKTFDNNIKQINKLDSLNNSIIRKGTNEDGSIKNATIDSSTFYALHLRPDVNEMDKDIMDLAYTLIDEDGNWVDVDSAQQLVSFVNGKILQLQNSNDAINIASLKWSNSPIVPLAEQVYDYSQIDERGMFTYNLGLVDIDGKEVPDQVILQDLQRESKEDLENNRNIKFNEVFK